MGGRRGRRPQLALLRLAPRQPQNGKTKFILTNTTTAVVGVSANFNTIKQNSSYKHNLLTLITKIYSH